MHNRLLWEKKRPSIGGKEF
jgi:hypothetical protein